MISGKLHLSGQLRLYVIMAIYIKSLIVLFYLPHALNYIASM